MPASETIVRYAVYPGIGIARVGNSPGEFFLGPQVPGEVPPPPYKDPAGRVKRQGAKFRVYGLNEAGEAIREITAADGEIEWRVHLANRKAVWYNFENAMDLGSVSKTAALRNRTVVGAGRRSLLIDPGSRTISGRDLHGPQYQFDTGEFAGKPVPLGELRTDADGRLVVLGGFGHSASGAVPPTPVTTFANNDDWHDDIADGPVRATVRIGGQTFEAEPAVVVVGPPNYGQGLYGVVTMYDVVFDLFARQGSLPRPARPSFSRDIYPIFARLVATQWVNQGFYFLFGHSSPSDLTSPGQLAKLSDPGEASRPDREALFHWFRNPEGTAEEPVRIPPFYGDGFGDVSGVLIDGLPVTVTQYGWLRQWAAGDFVADWGTLPPPAPALGDLPVQDQPHALDRAALEDCLGGPFHPGIEITWILRQPVMWKAPFRLKVLPEGEEPRDDYGPVLEPAVALSAGGPLAQSGPGTITRWMAVPWQTDAASCLSGYDTSTYLPIPSYWAARVPNQVLSEGSYSRAVDARLPRGQRTKHFDYRQFWLRDLGVSYRQRINDMVAQWDLMGIVEERPGPADHTAAHLPARFWVETGRAVQFSQNDPSWTQVEIAEKTLGVPEEEGAGVAEAVSTLAAAPPAEVPLQQRRRVYRRDER